jgi:hypothetical protein
MTATASTEAVGAMSVALSRTARDDSELLAALADDENLIMIFAALPGLQRQSPWRASARRKVAAVVRRKC